MPELRSETMTVNMGPQHPSTHGVLRIVLELSGETVVGADTTIGYLHTGIEKTAEQKKWQQVIPLVERMDYLGAQSNSLAFCLAVERLLGVEVPQRVRDIRVLIAELQRITSHLVWLGTHGLEIGAVSVMMYCFREREQLLNVNEMLAGFRMFPSYLRIGGLREDLPTDFHATVKKFLDAFPDKLKEYEDLLTQNQIWLKRTRSVGVIPNRQRVRRINRIAEPNEKIVEQIATSVSHPHFAEANQYDGGPRRELLDHLSDGLVHGVVYLAYGRADRTNQGRVVTGMPGRLLVKPLVPRRMRLGKYGNEQFGIDHPKEIVDDFGALARTGA